MYSSGPQSDRGRHARWLEFASLPFRHDVLLKLLILIDDLFGSHSPIYVSIPVTADPRTAHTFSDLAIVRPLVSSDSSQKHEHFGRRFYAQLVVQFKSVSDCSLHDASQENKRVIQLPV